MGLQLMQLLSCYTSYLLVLGLAYAQPLQQWQETSCHAKWDCFVLTYVNLTTTLLLLLLHHQAHGLADFLLPLLAFDPSERATAAQALKHPWITGQPAQRSREGQAAAAASGQDTAGRSSRHSSRPGSEHGSRRGSAKSERADGAREASGRKASGSKRSSRPSSFNRSRSRTRSKSRGMDKRAR